MTDKVQKIREEVERLQKRAKHNLDTSLTENERQFWLGESNVLTLIGKYIDSLQEEPVSEDLEKALASEWKAYNDRGAATVDALEDNTQELAFAKGFYRGSNWQRNQDQSTIELAEDHAMLAGMEKMREEIMAKAVDGKVISNEGLSFPISNEIYRLGLEEGDKVKVIVIKED